MLHFYDLISGLVPCYFAFAKKQDEAYKIFCFPTWTFWLGKGEKKKIRCAAAVYYVTFFFFSPVEKVLIPFLHPGFQAAGFLTFITNSVTLI